MVRYRLYQRPKFFEDLLQRDNVLFTILCHQFHAGRLATVDFDPQIPAFIIHFTGLSQKLCDRLEAIVKKEEILLRFALRIYVMDIRQWFEFVESHARLQKTPIETLSIMGNDTVCAFQDFRNRLANTKVIVNVVPPGFEVPRVDCMNGAFSVNLPPGNDY